MLRQCHAKSQKGICACIVCVCPSVRAPTSYHDVFGISTVKASNPASMCMMRFVFVVVPSSSNSPRPKFASTSLVLCCVLEPPPSYPSSQFHLLSMLCLPPPTPLILTLPVLLGDVFRIVLWWGGDSFMKCDGGESCG